MTELHVFPVTWQPDGRLEIVVVLPDGERTPHVVLRQAERHDQTGEWVPRDTGVNVALFLVADVRQALDKAAARGFEQAAWGASGK